MNEITGYEDDMQYLAQVRKTLVGALQDYAELAGQDSLEEFIDTVLSDLN